MGQLAIFERLGAPLPFRNSWGAVRQADGVVILTLWEDRIKLIDGVQHGRITHHSKRHGSEPLSQGWLREYEARLGHVALIRNGSPCYLVINRASDANAHTRSVASVDTDEVRVGGDLIEDEGETWIEVGEGVPIQEAARPLRD